MTERTNPLLAATSAKVVKTDEGMLHAHCERLNAMGFVRHNNWKYFVGKRTLENGEVVKFVDRLESFDWSTSRSAAA